MWLIALFFLFLPILVAYLVYQFLYFISKRVLQGREWGRIFIKNVQVPVLYLFLEMGALVTLRLWTASDRVKAVLHHGLVILLLATIGWVLVRSAKAIYTTIERTYLITSIQDVAVRSFITQAQILYRATLFVILCLTLAAILMTFPGIKNFGIGIISSAGIAGLALGFAARPILLNLIAGFQIAFTSLIKIGDVVVIEGETGEVEQITLTRVIIKTGDWRRVIFPISHFIDKPFQNWSGKSTELMAIVDIACDYKTPLIPLREQCLKILEKSFLWNKKSWSIDVNQVNDTTLKVRAQMSANTPQEAVALQNHMREELVTFLQKEHPEALPFLRYKEI